MSAYYLEDLLDPSYRRQVLEVAVSRLDKLGWEYDFIVARGMSGVTFGSILSYLLNKPLVLIRKGESTHSGCKEMEVPDSLIGVLKQQYRYIIVDDLIDSGHTVSTMRSSMKELGLRRNKELVCIGVYLYKQTFDMNLNRTIYNELKDLPIYGDHGRIEPNCYQREMVFPSVEPLSIVDSLPSLKSLRGEERTGMSDSAIQVTAMQGQIAKKVTDVSALVESWCRTPIYYQRRIFDIPDEMLSLKPAISLEPATL